jgi:hypothetical protein
MLLSRNSKNRKLRSSRSSLPLTVNPPTPPPTIRRRRIKPLGFLADRDPELVGKTRAQARKINNARISKIVTQLAGIRPQLDPPHHKKHCVGGPRLCVGTDVEDFSSIGKWIQYVCINLFLRLIFSLVLMRCSVIPIRMVAALNTSSFLGMVSTKRYFSTLHL